MLLYLLLIRSSNVKEFRKRTCGHLSKNLQYLEQLFAKNAPTARKIVQNVLHERIPPEVQERRPKPLRPKPYQPKAPPRQGKARRRQELLRTFDPVRPPIIRTVTDYQNEILHDVAKHDGKESRGRRYIRWRFITGLEKDLTTGFIEKIRENVHTAFYVRHGLLLRVPDANENTLFIHCFVSHCESLCYCLMSFFPIILRHLCLLHQVKAQTCLSQSVAHH